MSSASLRHQDKEQSTRFALSITPKLKTVS